MARSILCITDLDTSVFCIDGITGKIKASIAANEGIGTYGGVLKLGNDTANKAADPFLEDRFINLDAYSLNINADDSVSATGAFRISPLDFGFYNADSITGNASGLSNGSAIVQLYSNSSPSSNTMTLDPTSLSVSAYPETRDDTATTTPINFLYTDASGKVLSAPTTSLSVSADEGIGSYGGILKLGNNAANQTADPLLEDRYVNTDQYALQIGGSGASNSSSIDVGGSGIVAIAADNAPGAGTDSSNITVQATSVGASTTDGTNINTLTLLPTDMTVSAYPNVRDDSTGNTPINFLYTDAGGTVLSAPVSTLGGVSVTDTNSVDLTLTGSNISADVRLKPTDSSLLITPTGLTVNTPTKTATNECGVAITDATVNHSLAEVVKDGAGKLWSTIPTAHTKVSSGTGTFTYTVPGAIPVTNSSFATVVANGTVVSSPINTVTYTNPDSCRSMNLTIFLEWVRSVTVSQLNSFMDVRHQVFVDLGGGTLTLVALDDTRYASTNISSVSASLYGARMANVIIAPGASVTFRLQTTTTMTSSNMAVGSSSSSGVFAQLKIVDGGTV